MRWLRKAWGEFVGPEATAVDTTIALSLGALGAVIAPAPILRLAAADLWGGVWANNTKACARWYGRPGQTDADYLNSRRCTSIRSCWHGRTAQNNAGCPGGSGRRPITAT